MSSSKLDTDLLVRHTFVARVEHHVTLGSTNDRARQCAAEGGGSLPLLIVADEQTAGRGRGTNRWWTGRGSLACSLLIDPDALGIDRYRSSPLVALATAVAIVDTLAPVVENHAVGLHWPNDVFADGRKLAGILAEVLADRRIILGIGLNTNNALVNGPQELQKTATTLFDLTGVPHDRTRILLALLDRLEKALGNLASAPEQIAAYADEICLQKGQTLTVRSGRRQVSGRCEGIASDGALLLRTPQGLQRLYSGVLR
ncbi:MAG: biotin--[acetyl-CoA-carboxylase] ligase [Planctomycetes bacterium]|nr:biotin--[acetyl-CoA-carboxylase] ligase [Planctomycetota bacterium]